jgi:hypothetical protein
MTTQHLDNGVELLAEEAGRFMEAFADGLRKVHPAKVERLRGFLGTIRRVLTDEIEYCGKDYYPGGYG